MHRTGFTGLFIALAFLTGCAATPVTQAPADGILPAQAVQRAAEAAPRGAPGTFAMRVATIGMQDGTTYLNSEHDYRDQRNLTIALSPAVLHTLEARLGGDVRSVLQGQRILVGGEAQRVRIAFFADGARTDKYYYQTHVRLTDASLLRIEPGQ